MEEAFKRLLSAIVGNEPCAVELTKTEWQYCFEQVKKQCLVGVSFPVVQNYMHDESGKTYKPLQTEWLGMTYHTFERNRVVDEKAAMLARMFKSWGYQSCVLKGQGVARLYPDPTLRQSGDVDIWVNGAQDNIIRILKEHLIGITNIDYVHSGISIFNDVDVEVHFRPSWMYNPFTNKKLQRFFWDNAKEQFDHWDQEVGFAYPTIAFNLVYSLIHINRHIFEEGIGIRQLLDYYYILEHSTKDERRNAYRMLASIRLKRFVGAIMFIQKELFGIGDEYLLCEPNAKEGKFLLTEIMRGGNFGRYDARNKWLPVEKRLMRGMYNAKRNLRYLVHYPSEVVWIPVWKIWHWCWRKRKGYL